MKRKSYTPGERAALGAHMTQERLAGLGQALAALGGLAGAYWHGLPAIVLGGLGYWFFGLARPGPRERFDDWTGRGR